MASFFTLCVAIVAAVNMATVASNQIKVGDNTGWSEPGQNDTEIYSQWVSKLRFQVGDSLYFEYKNDSVLVVGKKSYFHCITADPIASFTDGRTTVPLDRPGPFYFISGAPDHCNNGQRLTVDVVMPHPHPLPPHQPPLPRPSPPPFSADAPSPSPFSSSAIAAQSSPIILMALSALVFLFLGWALPN